MVIIQCIWCSIKWNVWLQAQGKHGRNSYSSQEQCLWDYKQKARYILWTCNVGNNTGSGNNSWNFICQYLLKNRDGLFDSECVNAFFYAFTHSESFICLSDNSFEMKLWEIIPRQKQVFDWKTCKNVADFFAKIVDYKSSFTSRYSIEVAEKAAFFAQIMLAIHTLYYQRLMILKKYETGQLSIMKN